MVDLLSFYGIRVRLAWDGDVAFLILWREFSVLTTARMCIILLRMYSSGVCAVGYPLRTSDV